MLGYDAFAAISSDHDIALDIRVQVPPDVSFFSVNTYNQGFQFYMGRTTTIVAYKDELEFGIHQKPQKFIPDVTRFAAIWRQTPNAWALMPLDTWAQLKAQGLPMHEVIRDLHHVIVRRN